MMPAVLFDLDGVLINSKQLMCYAFTEGVRQLLPGVEPPLEAFLARSGDSLPNVVKQLGLPVELVQEFRRISMANLHMIQVVEGIGEVLEALQAQRIKMALVTGKEKDRTLEILQRFHLQRYFLAVVSPEDVPQPKPAPDAYRKALALLESQAAEAVSFGDAPNDILASKQAGVLSVGVTWGLFGRQVLLEAGADTVIESPGEIVSCVVQHVGGLRDRARSIPQSNLDFNRGAGCRPAQRGIRVRRASLRGSTEHAV